MFQDVARLISGYSRDVLGMFLKSVQNVLEMSSASPRDVLSVFSRCYRNILRMSSGCPRKGLAMCSGCPRVALRILSVCTWVAIVLLMKEHQRIARASGSVKTQLLGHRIGDFTSKAMAYLPRS